MKYRIVALLLLATIGCVNNSKKINGDEKSVNTKNDTISQNIKNSIKDSIKIDLNKQNKGFDNIYFGSQKISLSELTLNGQILSFEGNFDKKWGLYSFTLTGEFDSSKNPLSSVNEIKNIIETSYSEAKKINEKISIKEWQTLSNIDKSVLKPVRSSREVVSMIPPSGFNISGEIRSEPSDVLTTIFLYRFLKNSVVIKLGYQIDYHPIYLLKDNGYDKTYRIENYRKGFKIRIFLEDIERTLEIEKKDNEVKEIERKMKEMKREDGGKF